MNNTDSKFNELITLFKVPWWASSDDKNDFCLHLKAILNKDIPKVNFLTIVSYCCVHQKLSIPLATALFPSKKNPTVNLSRKDISDEQSEAIGLSLSRNCLITKLNLSDNKVGDFGAAAIGASLKSNTTVTSVDLSNNTHIGVFGATRLANVLKGSKTIKKFNMIELKDVNGRNLKKTAVRYSNQKLTDLEAIVIAEFVKNNTTLTSLDVSNNTAIGISGVMHLYAALKGSKIIKKFNMIELSDLNGSDLTKAVVCYKNKSVTDMEAIFFAEYMKMNSTVKTLNLSSNKIRDDGASAIANALKVNNVLTALDMRSNSGIQLEGAKILSNAILERDNIKTFSGIPIDDMKENKSETKSIDALKTGYGDTEALVIGSLLKMNSTIKELYLSGNKIGDLGASSIGDALKINTVLQILRLSQNNIGDSGATSIENALHINKHLKYVYLAKNNISSNKKKKLAKVMKKYYTIRFVPGYSV